MAMPELSSIPWFVVFMRLHNRGVVPTVTPSEFMPGHRALAEFWGPRSSLGYIFSDLGIPAYEIYVKQLFSRVLQLPWPTSGVLPFHFARGLVVEALGVEVNWAEFGYRVTRPHQSHSGIPRVLPEFRALVFPLRALPLVMPQAHISSPLAARIAGHLNEQGGGIANMENTLDLDDQGGGITNMEITLPDEGQSSPLAPFTPTVHVASKSPVQAQTMRIVIGGEGSTRECTLLALELPNTRAEDSPTNVPPVQEAVPNLEPAVKTESPVDNVPSSPHLTNGQRETDGDLRGAVTFDQSAVSAMLVLRPSFKASVDHECTRLHMASRGFNKPVSELRKCVKEQRQRLKLLEIKVSERSRSHEKAASALRRARDQLKAAEVNHNIEGRKDDMATGNSNLKMCEQLVELRTENVVFAYTQLESWEFKLNRQKERLSKAQDDLTAAQVLFKEKMKEVEKSLAHLHALSTALVRL